ncbi:MAG: acylphosphatase [Candidatus Eremiobacteraeota bacterium]|nr:acylphosphatase [Candidatus Eremiobacteraeota bacterium]
MKKRARFLIKGRVQGVGFRHFAWRQAQKLGINGYVRNLRDGSVEVVATGNENTLRHYARQLRRGPDSAYIRDFEEKWSENGADEFSGFDVRF